ncbi:MAG: TetR/AcrR family transcriptional regulator [Vulcanimicrobiaceae bacterium]
MSPRPYRQGSKRQAATEQTRTRIIDAARQLLMGESDPAGFTIDAVANKAGVARMTVYYQYESKQGLLAALFDDLGERGQMFRLREAFAAADPFDALARFIQVFMGFYASNRLFIRRLSALAALDSELNDALSERGGWRRKGLRTIVERIAEKRGRPAESVTEPVLTTLHALTSFEMFDYLATDGRTPQQAGTIVTRLAIATLDLDPH